MALLTLKDVGKIYVSGANVSVGIRGVNLSFERGEFVAVTGKSGSGKSTLLNVISGIDSYEEGELYIEGQSTSHYLQPEWEEYREKYISFIFQDYNIIDSFTVLQNVELALMHIKDKYERKAKALELIRRVGLTSHLNQKGSKLSGGQKQRTVIARALAKNSPIILADEPTGNLDSATSKEIIELLREVSRDKLLIVVTHNFDEVAAYATRHVRIFDGAVESDHKVKPTNEISEPLPEVKSTNEKTRRQTVRNGFMLGKTIFTSKPKLSVFLCLLMIIGTLGIFMITSLCGDATDFLSPHYMFNHIDGRVVVTTRDGAVLSDEEVNALKEKYGANDYLRFDALLDLAYKRQAIIPTGTKPDEYLYLNMECTYGEDFGEDIVGRYPTEKNEVLLYLPISYKPEIGRDFIKVEDISFSGINLKIVGIKYYYDNNIPPKCLFTEEGFRTATALHFLMNLQNTSITLNVEVVNEFPREFSFYNIVPSFDMPEDKIYIDSQRYYSMIREMESIGVSYDVLLTINTTYYTYVSGAIAEDEAIVKTFFKNNLTNENPSLESYYDFEKNERIIMSDELIVEFAEELLGKSYKQFSLFFENDEAAYDAAEIIQDDGFIAVPSDTTYEPDPLETIASALLCLMLGIVWIMTIVFLAFFINLCSSRVIGAFKSDMAIMRSMGISVSVIRIGIYVRMLISLIPAFIMVIATAILIFTTPTFNEQFVYLYAWQYALIFIGMLILTVRITHKQIGKLFGESVKKSLRGGAAE